MYDERVQGKASEPEYPVLEVNLSKMEYNLKKVVSICRENGIDVAWVVKGFHALLPVMELFRGSGCKFLASSRLTHLERAREQGLTGPFLLIRIPMLSEIPRLVRFVEYSLNSEPAVIRRIQEEAERQGTLHQVILMADLGDLREGFWEESRLIETAVWIENCLPNVKLAGVGTNLGCYGSVKATPEKMEALIAIAERVEERIGRRLEIISGGSTTSFPMVMNGNMPPRVNHLRIGEQIESAFTCADLGYFNDPEQAFFHQDAFVLKAEVIEVNEKPTYPVGELTVDCFGEVGTYQDRGIKKRALVGVGKVDYGYLDLMQPLEPGIKIIGASSDHTILEIEDCPREIKVGDLLSFSLTYSQIAMLTEAPLVRIEYVR